MSVKSEVATTGRNSCWFRCVRRLSFMPPPTFLVAFSLFVTHHKPIPLVEPTISDTNCPLFAFALRIVSVPQRNGHANPPATLLFLQPPFLEVCSSRRRIFIFQMIFKFVLAARSVEASRLPSRAFGLIPTSTLIPRHFLLSCSDLLNLAFPYSSLLSPLLFLYPSA